MTTSIQTGTGAAEAVRNDRTVLVRCRSGYNRSGLVVAQTLIELGRDPATAIALIRQSRSPWVLNNQTFEQYLSTGLDVAYLPGRTRNPYLINSIRG
ncbi:protein-tyrosine phosphatase family protein [Kitasatospora sp. NPDC001574]